MIQTVFDLKVEDVCELLPGQSIVVKKKRKLETQSDSSGFKRDALFF